MSASHTETPETSLAKLLNLILNFAVPGVLLIMLGWVGFKFVAGMGDTKEEREAAAAAIAEAKAAEEAALVAAAGGGGGAPAPAPGGDGSAAPAAAGGIPAEVMDLGKQIYTTNCGACHGPDGQGLQVGAAKMAPSFTGSEILMGDPDAAILIVLKGIQKEGMDYMGMMAALGTLSDDKIAAVLTYGRNEFDNQGDPITVEQVAAARAKFADVEAPVGVKRAEINSIVESHK